MKQEVKIFLGGGVVLLEGNENMKGYRPSVVDPAISKLNSRRDADRIYIVKTFSDLIHEYAPEGQQEHYHRYVDREADIALFIFDGTIGDRTKEEVAHACNSYNKHQHPTVYFYGKNLKDDDEIVTYLTSKNQYFQHFKDKEHLLNLIQIDLSQWKKQRQWKKILLVIIGCLLFGLIALTMFHTCSSAPLIPSNEESDSLSVIVDTVIHKTTEQVVVPVVPPKSTQTKTNSSPVTTTPKATTAQPTQEVETQQTAEELNQMGENYYYGRNGYPKDYAEAVKWYRKAAEQGDARGQCNLGYMYENGRGVTQDYTEAVKWYRKAAEQGHASGQYNLGVMYDNGRGVTQDYIEAVKWYRKAAEQGCASAQYNLGVMYKNGRGVTQDYTEAVKWYRKAAEQGDASGQNNLGWMYDNGRGVTQDYIEAVKWYRKAAEQGYASAQYNLGWMYYYGQGVDENKEQAKKYFQQAAKQGDQDAKTFLEEHY